MPTTPKKPAFVKLSLLFTLLLTSIVHHNNQILIVDACTNILVTAGASVDESPMIAYNSDAGDFMGMLYHYPADASKENTNEEKQQQEPIMRKIYDWDTGHYLGSIPEYTGRKYNVVGNTNEMGLVITESTFGGVSILSKKHQPQAVVDYGSLMYLTLQRASTCKEAIDTMVAIMDEYGYASDGESFSIADRITGQVWIMEVIGRGETKKGAVWVARRIPDGYISAHSNQARITTFPRNDPSSCRYSEDVVDLAKKLGLYTSAPDDPRDLHFSFSDVYDPITFYGARFCEARTWSIFRLFSHNSTSFSPDDYLSYALGTNLTNRMPLWIQPHHKLSLEDVAQALSNHYEGTPLECHSDLGAGMYASPYRPSPLVWNHDYRKYFNERTTAVPQTGFHLIAQIRTHLPPRFSSILWFALDDSSTAPRYPVYGCSTSVSSAYYGKGPQDGVPEPLLEFDLTKAFWVQNMVSHFAYTRWSDVYPILQERIAAVQERFQVEVRDLDDAILELLESHGGHDDTDVDDATMDKAVEMATNYSVAAGDKMHQEWMGVYGELFVRFRDFYTTTPDPDNTLCKCKVEGTGMSDAWRGWIVQETKSRYEVPSSSSTLSLEDGMEMGGWVEDDGTSGTPPKVVITKGSALRASKSMIYRVQDDPNPAEYPKDFTTDKTKLLAML